MTRAGSDLLWTPVDRPQSHLSIIEAVPIGILLAVCLALMIQAGPIMNYMEETAQALGSPHLYTDAVLSAPRIGQPGTRSEEHTSELQSLMRISYAVFCLKKQIKTITTHTI